jgi:hypothetical protein
MIDFAFYNFVGALTFVGTLHYGNANNITPPYVVMYKISDDERPYTLCQEQGESGEALFIFDYYAGAQDNYAVNQEMTLQYANDLKEQIRQKKGNITYGANTYKIWHNQTTGAVIVDDGMNESNIFTARFTTLLRWDLVS